MIGAAGDMRLGQCSDGSRLEEPGLRKVTGGDPPRCARQRAAQPLGNRGDKTLFGAVEDVVRKIAFERFL